MNVTHRDRQALRLVPAGWFNPVQHGTEFEARIRHPSYRADRLWQLGFLEWRERGGVIEYRRKEQSE